MGTDLVQTAFTTAEFADNPEVRCPCLLLLDRSRSMMGPNDDGKPINDLNEGLITFKNELMRDPMAIKRVEVATLSFGPINIEHDFITADQFAPPHLSADGDTPMGRAIDLGLDMLRDRKAVYKANAVPYYRPWVFLITDGSPTDRWEKAAERIRQGELDKAFSFYAVGVEGANMKVLAQISHREPLKLIDTRFSDMFRWLSSSLSAVSHSTPGDAIPLENPKAGGGWAVAET